MKKFYIFTIIVLTLNAYDYNSHSKDATKYTKNEYKKYNKQLNFKDKQDFDFAYRGFIAPLLDTGVIKVGNKKLLDIKKYKAIIKNAKSPNTINPSLYRLHKLLTKSGLFKVIGGVYQVRGYGFSNITFIEGRKGITIVNTLASPLMSKNALKLYYRHRPSKPIVAIIYTSDSIDSFGGASSLVSQIDINSGKVKIYAPKNFNKNSLNKYVNIKNIITRREQYENAQKLHINSKGAINSGKGLNIIKYNSNDYIAPTNIIKGDANLTIDGIKYNFILPKEFNNRSLMLWYIPSKNLLGGANLLNHTLDKLYSLSGSKISNGIKRVYLYNKIIKKYKDDYKIVISSYMWPIFGNININRTLKQKRDTYKFIHDRTLHLANKGYSVDEIAKIEKLPKSLQKSWINRGYYGSISQNSRAIYKYYLGYFDGNLSNLNPLSQKSEAQKFTKLVGRKKIMREAQKAFKVGQYKWAINILNKLVFAEPDNKKAKLLLADCLEQLAYQSENAIVRNIYLSGVKELRFGIKKDEIKNNINLKLPIELLLNNLAIRLDYKKMGEIEKLKINLIVDTDKKYTLLYENGVLNYSKDNQYKNPNIILKLSYNDMVKLFNKDIKLKNINISGNKIKFKKLLDSLIDFNNYKHFHIITP